MPLLPPPPTPLTVCALVFALFQTTTQLLVLERTVRVHQLAFSKVRSRVTYARSGVGPGHRLTDF